MIAALELTFNVAIGLLIVTGCVAIFIWRIVLHGDERVDK